MQQDELTQTAFAERVGLSTAQVRALGNRGLPRLDNGKYPWPDARDWYLEFKLADASRRSRGGSGSEGFDRARTRKMSAEADLKEIDLATRRGELIPVDMHVGRLATVCDQIRARLLAVPDRWALQLVGLEDEAETRAILEDAVQETLEDLASIGLNLPTTVNAAS